MFHLIQSISTKGKGFNNLTCMTWCQAAPACLTLCSTSPTRPSPSTRGWPAGRGGSSPSGGQWASRTGWTGGRRTRWRGLGQVAMDHNIFLVWPVLARRSHPQLQDTCHSGKSCIAGGQGEGHVHVHLLLHPERGHQHHRGYHGVVDTNIYRIIKISTLIQQWQHPYLFDPLKTHWNSSNLHIDIILQFQFHITWELG